MRAAQEIIAQQWQEGISAGDCGCAANDTECLNKCTEARKIDPGDVVIEVDIDGLKVNTDNQLQPIDDKAETKKQAEMKEEEKKRREMDHKEKTSGTGNETYNKILELLRLRKKKAAADEKVAGSLDGRAAARM